MSDMKPMVEFDHNSDEYTANSVAIMREIRQKCPVAYTETAGGFWVVAKHADVTKADRDTATFSSHRGGVVIPTSPVQSIPITLDPPEHGEFRRLISSQLTGRRTTLWDEFTLQATTSCINAIVASGKGDLVYDVLNPITALVTMKILGLDLSVWKQYAVPFHDIVAHRPGTPGYETGLAGINWVRSRLYEEITMQRDQPRDGLIAHLLKSQVFGRELTDDELVLLAQGFIAGGVDTTTALLSGALVFLEDNPEYRERLRINPDLVRPATEEFLRYFSPSQGQARTATVNTEVGGQPVCEGEKIWMAYGSANRDEAVFTDPDEMILDRSPNPHLAFGTGNHLCLGAAIARMEVKVILPQILQRLADYHIEHAAGQKYTRIGTINGYMSLPAIFTPGPVIDGGVPGLIVESNV